MRAGWLALVGTILFATFPVRAQLRPEAAPKPKKSAPARKSEKPPEPIPAQLVVQTSPEAEVYLDDQFQGRAGAQGRLVIGNPKLGSHKLRVSLAGKRAFEQDVTVAEGETKEIAAALTDLPSRLSISTSPGAEVFVDEQSRGRADSAGQLTVLDVSPRTHSVSVRAPGKREWNSSLELEAGKTKEVSVPLVELNGALAVQTVPGASIEFDGVERGQADAQGGLRLADVSPGTHQLRVSHEGYEPWRQPVEVKGGEVAEVRAGLKELPPPLPPPKPVEVAPKVEAPRLPPIAARFRVAWQGHGPGELTVANGRVSFQRRKQRGYQFDIPVGEVAEVKLTHPSRLLAIDPLCIPITMLKEVELRANGRKYIFMVSKPDKAEDVINVIERAKAER